MRILPKETIDNIPILKVRDFFSYLLRYRVKLFSTKRVSDYFEIDEAKTKSLLKELLAKGFIEKKMLSM